MTWLRVRDWLGAQRMDLTEAGFVLVALCGLALLTSMAWSLVAGGVLGVVACERASTVRKQRPRGKKSHLERIA
jgi:hypothetical protein